MSKSFPVRPSLEQLKKQAKELLKSHKSGNPDGLRRIQEKHPDWGNRSELELRATRFSLGDAQLVIAREYGCASWPKLKAQVESILAANKNPVAAPGSGVTWNKMYYRYRTSTDGKRKWLWVPFRRLRMAYQPPGLHRETEIDAQGQICRMTITDPVRGQELTCSPIMGGASRWNILGDRTLSDAMPEVFAPPPVLVAEFLSEEGAATLRRSSPLAWAFMRARGLLVTPSRHHAGGDHQHN